MERSAKRRLVTMLGLVAALAAPAPLAFAQQAAAQPQPGVAPATPPGFELNPIEREYLDRVLEKWEAESGKVRTFSCDFTRLVYDPVFGPGDTVARNEERGTLSYQQPDKGSFEIKRVKAWDAEKNTHVENPNIIGEHWVCDGEAVYEYKTTQKELYVRPIPPELRGRGIVDSPLPFVFGAEAQKLRDRFWIKLDPRTQPGTIRMVVAPKRQEDAANYRMVELMLDAERMLPVAIQVHQPDESRLVYLFDLDKSQVNSRVTQLWSKLFQSPITPIGWTKVVDQQQPAQAQQPGAAPR